MVAVAQLVELLVVVQAVAGSNPVSHPLEVAANRRLWCRGRRLDPDRGRDRGLPWVFVGTFKAISCCPSLAPVRRRNSERHYWDVHVPLAAAIPGTVSLTLTRTDQGLEGAEPSYYRVAETVFESKADLERAMGTPEWEALRADAAVMHSRFGVTLENGLGTPEPVNEGCAPVQRRIVKFLRWVAEALPAASFARPPRR